MLEYYSLDPLTISIIMITTVIIYKLIDIYDEYNSYTEFFKIISSMATGFAVSVLYSHYNVEPDVILKSGYWD